MTKKKIEPTRCNWCIGDELYEAYHDTEWGVPCFDEAKLFEMLLLEGAQAGLSWITVLRKRENYRKAYAGFDVKKLARFSDEKLVKLKQDPGIIRNRLKIESARRNARATIELWNKGETLSEFVWKHVDGKPIQNAFTSMKQVPASTDISDALSKDLKRAGFNFVGSTICYAFMQACGMSNDHILSCHRHADCTSLGAQL